PIFRTLRGGGGGQCSGAGGSAHSRLPAEPYPTAQGPARFARAVISSAGNIGLDLPLGLGGQPRAGLDYYCTASVTGSGMPTSSQRWRQLLIEPDPGRTRLIQDKCRRAEDEVCKGDVVCDRLNFKGGWHAPVVPTLSCVCG